MVSASDKVTIGDELRLRLPSERAPGGELWEEEGVVCAVRDAMVTVELRSQSRLKELAPEEVGAGGEAEQ